MNILEDIKESLLTTLDSDTVELEFIYGSRPNETVTQETFRRVLDYCKTNYEFSEETNVLDIRKQEFYKNKPVVGNIRCSIEGLSHIMDYCKTSRIQNEIYVKKKFVPGVGRITNEEYNYRINVKREEPLRKKNEEIVSFLQGLDTSLKHFRYKKRYSFMPVNRYFRIDLTIVKGTSWNSKLQRYEFAKTFVEGILNQKKSTKLKLNF